MLDATNQPKSTGEHCYMCQLGLSGPQVRSTVQIDTIQKWSASH